MHAILKASHNPVCCRAVLGGVIVIVTYCTKRQPLQLYLLKTNFLEHIGLTKNENHFAT